MRKTAVGLVVLMVLLLAACGSQQSASESKPDPTSVPIQPDAIPKTLSSDLSRPER